MYDSSTLPEFESTSIDSENIALSDSEIVYYKIDPSKIEELGYSSIDVGELVVDLAGNVYINKILELEVVE